MKSKLVTPIRVIGYKLNRLGLVKAPRPLTLTFSVTNMCQSRCKTCNIWKLYIDKPKLKEKELSLSEIEKIFKSLGRIYFFNISGGEPFLRKDLPEIVDLACKYLKPEIIHTPTNGIATDLILKQTEEILKIMKKNGYGNIPFTIKPSFDGVGDKQDEVRGVKGNFKKTLETIKGLKKLAKKYDNLYVGLGTVISNFNIDHIKEVSEYAHSLNVDTYINEIAEQRSELFNENDPITPTANKYEKVMKYFKKRVKEEMKNKRFLAKFTQAFRLVYYDLVVKIVRENKQVIPCYAGLSNVHISPYGQVWPCCILGYRKPMGDLRKVSYDFNKIWYSPKASKVRKFIKDKKCACPLANQAYSNIICDPLSMFKVIGHMLK